MPSKDSAAPIETDSLLQEAERRKIAAAMKDISRSHFLHGLIEASTGRFLRPRSAASDLCVILNTMPETQWRERLAIVTALRYAPLTQDMESQVVEALGRALHNDYAAKPVIAARRAAVAAGRASLCAMTALLGIVAVSVLPLFSSLFFLPALIMGFAFGLLFLASPLVFLCSPINDSDRNYVVQMAAAETLAKLQLPESVGDLAKAGRWENRISNLTRDALTMLLPTFAEDHYGKLGAGATPELCALLFHRDASDALKRLILEALAKVGDGRAVEPVEKLAQRFAETPELTEFAVSILPILTARREQENASSALLRGSSAPPVATEQLLRPASAPPVTPPELLLRPALETKASPPTLLR